MTIVSFHDPVANQEIDYSVAKVLDKSWRQLSRSVIKNNRDKVYVVVGRERSGKSFWTFQQAKRIDPTFNLDRICFTPEQFLKQIQSVSEGKVVVFDEAFRGFSSRAALSKVNRILIQAMMEVGRRNLIIFIVLPSLNLLDSYIASHRCNLLFHIYEIPGKKYRFWRCYTEKNKLLAYQLCKKNLGIMPMLKTRWKGNFFVKRNVNPRGLPYNTFDWKAYDKKKNDTFTATETKDEDGVPSGQINYKKLHNEYRLKEAEFYMTTKFPLTIKNKGEWIKLRHYPKSTVAGWIEEWRKTQNIAEKVVSEPEEEENEPEEEGL